MEEQYGTLRAGRSSDTEESEESTETTTTQDMEKEPSGTLRAGRSSDIEELEEWTETTGSLEGTEEDDGFGEISEDWVLKDKAEIQEMDGPSGTQISPKTENKTITKTSKGTQSLVVKTDEESVPLDSQTGALVPVQHSPLYYLRRLLHFRSRFSFPTSQTRKEDPASFEGKISKIRSILLSTYSYYWGYFQAYYTVGIFSRSSESDYEWLIKQLKSELFHSTVSTVLPHYISNNGMRKFRDAVSGCTFGILYHTKNRGRINIVDVSGSLYDEELKYLSEHLGKGKVIVVVDDLEDTSDVEKTRILESQPSIGTLARDLFLFSASEKPVMTISEITQES